MADDATIERLRQEIARDRLRLAQALATAPEPPQTTEDGEPARVGRLYRVLMLMGQC